MAPNVTASEIINSHIVSLREGIEYGDSSIRAPPCPCMAISDSLTVPPISKRLQFRAQNKQQIEPQNSHEMPIRRGRFERTLSKRGAARDNSSHHQSKRDDSCKHMQSVHRGKDVVERAIRIRREVKALRRELPPGFELPGNENESEREGGHEPSQTHSNGTGFKGRNGSDRATRHLQSGAAQEKRQRICIKYGRQGDVRPIPPRCRFAKPLLLRRVLWQLWLREAASLARRGAAFERADKLWMTFFPVLFLRRQVAETLSSPPRILSIRSAGGRLRRILHDVVALRTLHIILIGVVINDGMLAAKIIPGWRGRNTPLERGSVPRVFRSRRALITAVNQVEDEDELRGASAESGYRDELVQRHQRPREIIHERRIPPDVAHQSEVMERHENAVGTDEGEPEM